MTMMMVIIMSVINVFVYNNYCFCNILGWKRELVFRSTNEGSNKRNSDVYYYTPKGKKVRSFREVIENCKYSSI